MTKYQDSKELAGQFTPDIDLVDKEVIDSGGYGPIDFSDDNENKKLIKRITDLLNKTGISFDSQADKIKKQTTKASPEDSAVEQLPITEGILDDLKKGVGKLLGKKEYEYILSSYGKISIFPIEDPEFEGEDGSIQYVDGDQVVNKLKSLGDPVLYDNDVTIDKCEKLLKAAKEDLADNLTEYIHNKDLKAKVKAISLDYIESSDNGMGFEATWLVTTNTKLLENEEQSLIDYMTGQMSDGWGEGFEQTAFMTNKEYYEFQIACEECNGDGVDEPSDEDSDTLCKVCDGEGVLYYDGYLDTEFFAHFWVRNGKLPELTLKGEKDESEKPVDEALGFEEENLISLNFTAPSDESKIKALINKPLKVRSSRTNQRFVIKLIDYNEDETDSMQSIDGSITGQSFKDIPVIERELERYFAKEYSLRNVNIAIA